MKICIYGAGAIGGYLGVQLALQGHELSLVARGAHLSAIKQHGLRLRMAGEERVARIFATVNPAELGVQDYVIITLKAYSVSRAIDAMKPL